MSKARVLEQLSVADQYSVLGDDFGWSWDIGVFAVVDGTMLFGGNGRPGIDGVRRLAGRRLQLVPRVRQVLGS